MKMIRLFLFGMVALWALPLTAILPPDAQFRKAEIVQQRVRARAEYEQQQKDYGRAMITSRSQMEAAMKKAPWMRTSESKAPRVVNESIFLEQQMTSQINHRFLVSVVLLILIGVAAGWVRYMTRELDE